MKGEIIMKKLLSALLLGILLNGMCLLVSAQMGGTMQVKIFFPTDKYEDDDKLIAVERTVKKTTKVADAALRELLKGVNDEEKKRGLISVYETSDIITGRDECQSNKMKPLGAYLIGVSVSKKGVATVNFKPEAECYLQSAISMMNRVMNPIEKTLMQFKTIKKVQYALNGKVITEWDA